MLLLANVANFQVKTLSLAYVAVYLTLVSLLQKAHCVTTEVDSICELRSVCGRKWSWHILSH